MDDVEAEEKRNVQPAFFHGHVLKQIRPLRADDVEERADLAIGDQVVQVIAGMAGAGHGAGGILGQLADLFREGHLGEERFHAFIQRLRGQLRIRFRRRWLNGFFLGG